MLDRRVLLNNQGSYEAERTAKKLGPLSMFLHFVKATIGLAIFGFHDVYQYSGVFMGLILSAVFIFTVTQGCMRIVTYADELEAKYPGYRIDTYNGRRVLSRTGGADAGGPVVGEVPGHRDLLPRVLLDHGIYVLGGHRVQHVHVHKRSNLSDLLNADTLTAKLLVLGLVILALSLMVEPEKLVFLSYFTVGLVIALSTPILPKYS